jgi:hypothetical protein
MHKIKNSDIEPLIGEKNGNVAAIARALHVQRNTIYDHIAKSPKLAKMLEDSRQTMLDNVESSLYREVLGGNVTAMIFWLKTQGKRRGWVERTEVTGADGGPIEYVNESELDREIAALVAEHERRAQVGAQGQAEEAPVS